MKIESLEKAARSADARNDFWSARYYRFAIQFLRSRKGGEPFTGEDLREWIQQRIGAPKNPNAWGGLASGVISYWLRTEQVERAGMGRMQSVKSNGRLTPQYRRPGGLLTRLWRKLAG